MNVVLNRKTPTEVVYEIEGNRRSYVRLSRWPDPLGWTLTDIVVDIRHQGKGYGRALMKEALDHADRAGLEVALVVAPVGGLPYEAVDAWYRRLGFTEDDIGMMRRQPLVREG